MTEVPHLTTALTGPLAQIEQAVLKHQTQIEAWFREQFQKTPPPLTCSVDLRNAGFKIASVDTNLFPAGFNNINPDFTPLCITAAQAYLNQYYPNCKRLLLIAESHTKHMFYYQSLARLQDILRNAGYEVRVGSLLENLNSPKEIPLPDGQSIMLEPVVRHGDAIAVGDFRPCLLINNNDFSDGIPAILQGTKQRILPSLKLGWSQRTKSKHFEIAAETNIEFAKIIGLDAWQFTPMHQVCDEIDFVNRQGEACLMNNIAQLLAQVQAKYDEYGITNKPFAVVKADSGTYGMGILMVKEPKEIEQLNRKQRAKLSTLKGAQKLNRVIIQEGVYSFETWGEEHAVAEPVIYMLGSHVVGGFYRVHTARGSDENLNAPGMHFEPLAFAKPCNNPHPNDLSKESVNRFYTYGVVARLSLLAAAKEAAALGIQHGD